MENFINNSPNDITSLEHHARVNLLIHKFLTLINYFSDSKGIHMLFMTNYFIQWQASKQESGIWIA